MTPTAQVAMLGAMEPDERPPTLEADYRLVRGPWPRWMLHMSLIRLAARTAIIVAVLIMIAVALVWRLRA